MKIFAKWIIILSAIIDALALFAYLYSRNTYYRVQFEKMIPIIIISTVILTATIIVRVLMQRKD